MAGPKVKKDKPNRQAVGQVDIPFLILTVLLVVIGLVMLLSASYPTAYYDVKKVTNNDAFYYFKRQLFFALIGFVVIFFISKANYQALEGLAIYFFVFACILMLAVKVPGLGVTANGATRWLKYPIQFQPSEFGKMGIILLFSSRISKRDKRVLRQYNRRGFFGRIMDFLQRIGFLELIPYVFFLGIVVALLLIEPHMSATIQILAVAAAILFVGGVGVWWFLFGGLVVGGGLAYIISQTSYMASRIALWQDPWSDAQNKGYQAIQSLLSIGSGGLTGLGLGNGRQKFLFLPEPQNDFIFSVVCEELGFIGAMLILGIFVALIIRGYWLAFHARDRFGGLVTIGIVTLIAFQVFLNVAVVSNLFPVTGISLPFFSYGGTALIIQMAEMGLVLCISRQRLVDVNDGTTTESQ